MNPTEFAIRMRLDAPQPDDDLRTADALRAVLDLCEVVERNRANFDALGTGHLMVSVSHDIRRVIAEHLGVTDVRCVRCGGEGPFNSAGWCQDCASPVYT